MYIAIDNGKKGSIVHISDDGTIMDMIMMPLTENKEYDIKSLYQYFLGKKNQAKENNESIVVALEKCHTMPVSGNKANFINGYQYGIMQTILQVLQIPYSIISASTWQKVMFKGMTIKDTKKASIEWCRNRFPNESFIPSPRCKKPSDGLTDATCLAMYAREKRL